MKRWHVLVLSLAALKITVGAAGFFHGLGTPLSEGVANGAIPAVLSCSFMLVYGSVGAFLVANRVRDERALYLGASFLLVAASPSDRLFPGLDGTPRLLEATRDVLTHLHPDAFLPLCFWLFFGSFPRPAESRAPGLIPRIGVLLSAVGGVLLFLLHATPVLSFGPLRQTIGPFVAPLQPSRALYLYTWAFLLGLTVPALVYSVARTRAAPIQERRRAALFLAGIIMGSLPFWLAILLRALGLVEPTPQSGGGLSLYVIRLGAMTIPVTTAYSVLVHQVLDVKLVVRQAIQYALARYAVLAATGIPFLGLVGYIYLHREATIAELLSGTGPVVLLTATALGLAMMQWRHRVLAAIDRYFFREHYDSRQILMSLVEGSRRASNPRELADLLSAEIDRALHLERISVFVLDAARGELFDRNRDAPSVLSASPVATLVSAQEEPLDVDWTRARSALARLPEEDRAWLRDSGFRLLVPLIASDGTLVGIAALGSKKSELPFSREDRALLATIAASAALTLENRIKVSSPGDWPGPGTDARSEASSPPPQELALECEACGRMAPPESERCRKCEGALRTSNVPYVLLSKFRFEQRIGSGGMGVVYRAMDLTLGRRVAIKTLPRISMEFASRLRREARAMAAVTHENLAVVHGVESWLGAPLLVVELLEGGTLASRLRAGPLEPSSALELGTTLARALESMHGAGVLHRDLKPSNVGYTASGTVKLLDFGLAKILDDSRTLTSVHPDIAYEDLEEVPAAALTVLTVTRSVVGTPIYLSPEAARGHEPDPRFDLWALAVVLFEAIAGTHPLGIQRTAGLRQRIFDGDVADLRTVLDPCPEPLAELFDDALARDENARPASAGEFLDRLQEVRDRLA